MTTELKDAMATAVIKEVWANPEKYPQTIANIDLNLEDYDLDGQGLPSNQLAIERADKEGLAVVYPAENELQIDIDNEQSYAFFERHCGLVNRFVGIEGVTEKPSKSGLPKRHITLRLRTPLTTLERICLQACLGSDRVREFLGYVRYKNNNTTPTLFFEKKES